MSAYRLTGHISYSLGSTKPGKNGNQVAIARRGPAASSFTLRPILHWKSFFSASGFAQVSDIYEQSWPTPSRSSLSHSSPLDFCMGESPLPPSIRGSLLWFHSLNKFAPSLKQIWRSRRSCIRVILLPYHIFDLKTIFWADLPWLVYGWWVVLFCFVLTLLCAFLFKMVVGNYR